MYLRLFYVFLLTALQLSVFSQSKGLQYVDFKPIQVSKMESLFAEGRFCIDSTGSRTYNCPVDYQRIGVEFFKVYYNAKTRTLKLIGRTGLPSVGLYVSKDINRFNLDSAVCETTELDKKYWNYGFFDVEIQLDESSQLFFYLPSCYALRYRIGDFLKVAQART
jgi:hypothetical protein